MTYLAFLVLFVMLPIGILGLVLRQKLAREHWAALGVLSLVALVWTTPWDNYLVATNVWWYDESRILGIVLGYVPIEEYSFFVLQTFMTGLFTLWLMRTDLAPRGEFQARHIREGIALCAIIGLLVLVPLATGDRQWNYFVLQVGWLALPPFITQYVWGLDIFLYYRRVWFVGVFVPTVWLIGMDIWAIDTGVWTIDPEQTIPPRLFGILPLEEALFFLVTNLLVVQGIILFTVPQSWQRLRRLQATYRQNREHV